MHTSVLIMCSLWTVCVQVCVQVLKRITGLIPCVLLSVITIIVPYVTFPLICLLLWKEERCHWAAQLTSVTDGEFWILSFIQIRLTSCPDGPAHGGRGGHTFPPGWDPPTGESPGAQGERGDPAGERNGQGKESQWGGRQHFPWIGY